MTRKPQKIDPEIVDAFVDPRSEFTRPAAQAQPPAAPPAAPDDDEVRSQLNVILPLHLVRWLRQRASSNVTATGVRRSTVSAIVQQALERLRAELDR